MSVPREITEREREREKQLDRLVMSNVLDWCLLAGVKIEQLFPFNSIGDWMPESIGKIVIAVD